MRSRTRMTVIADHAPPFGVSSPRSFRMRAIELAEIDENLIRADLSV
jgi:hypothetical protein